MAKNEDTPQEDEKAQQETPKKKIKFNKKFWQILLLILVLMGASAYAGFWWGDKQASDEAKQAASEQASEKQKTINELKQQIKQLQGAAEESTGDDDEETTTDTATGPTSADLENIEAAVSSGNYAALEGYMAGSINVILAATECCGALTPAKAVAQMSYLDNGTDPWDFDLPAADIAGYQAGFYSDYFPADALVGKAANGVLVSFSFDTAGDIDVVFMTISDSIL